MRLILIAGTLLAGVHWIWAIVDVINRHDMEAFQKRFWLIIVIAVPVFGAMCFMGCTMKETRSLLNQPPI